MATRKTIRASSVQAQSFECFQSKNRVTVKEIGPRVIIGIAKEQPQFIVLDKNHVILKK